MIWTIALLGYFVVAAVLGVAGHRMGRATALIGIVPFLAHLLVIGWRAVTGDGPPLVETVEWVPSLGIAIGFRVDVISLLLSALVAGIGALIVVYSRYYFGPGPRLSRFLALLALFTGGMAGIVSSDQLYGLFLFWEITTAASYLLIGFDHEKAAARAAALQALLVTTLGGLAMLAGFVVIAVEAGTTSLAALAASPPSGSAISIALVLVFFGAFTKSAQVPFHFWLPGAMAAPTPASAYLHSATMVKAGVVLLVMLAPAFASDPLWTPVVATVGLVTMVVGAVIALGQHDLKLLLAYSTVSQLGFMTALLGLNLVAAAVAVLVAHAAFKAGLFLVVGVIDKATGTRDIRELSGLRRASPTLAAAASLLAMSMAGVAPLLGFVTKEGAYDALISQDAWVPLTVIAFASVMTVVYSVRFWWGAFGGDAAPSPAPNRIVKPMAAVPALLGGFSLGVGLIPGALGSLIADGTAQKVKLVLWPGFTPALAVSTAVLTTGFGVAYRFRGSDGRTWSRPTAAGVYRSALRGLNRVADVVTGLVQNGSLPVYLAVILLTVVAVPSLVWLTAWDGNSELPLANGAAELALAAAAGVAAVAATRVQRRLAAVLLLGTVGYAVAGIYVVFGAPDLALTQLLVETLTIALFAIVLVKLPRRFGTAPMSLTARSRLFVAAAVGVFASLAAVVIATVSPDRDVAAAYIDNAAEAGGSNVVNVILTNFRALDTLGEITVLAAAGIGISALVAAGRTRREEFR